MEKLYLTERQDIIGPHENRSKFAEILVGYGAAQARTPDHPWQQLGTWILIGMTGRWQRTLALWEWANGWDGFSDMIVSTTPRRRLVRGWQEELWLAAPGSRLAGPETAARF